MTPPAEAIAVTGIGCRVAGARSAEEFWQLVGDGVDAITEVPAQRWDPDELYHPDPSVPGRMNTRWGSFVDDIGDFDADFFSIAPVEAAAIDPQQRMILEVAYEALEDAGVPASTLAGSRTGVYIGACGFDHGVRQFADNRYAGPYTGTGSVLSIIANRLSYVLDLRGPSIVVDTACSSSLVAVHAACQALRAGEVPLALAGGVSAVLNPNVTIGFSKGGFMAPDGRCKTFDERADGYVRGEGAGVVVLRRLADAVADGDRVYAVIAGGAVNSDGRSNGLFAPNRIAQEALLQQAYEAAGVDPADVDYVEAHGTGTALGDPIEVGALATVLAAGRDAGRPLRIGSIKTNLGHLEAAAGIAGLIKTVLSVRHRTLLPNLHFHRPNPRLRLDRVPIVVQTRREPWPDRPAADLPVAGVSAFGFGGTNAHVVVRAHEPVTEPDHGDGSGATPGPLAARAMLLPLSAKTEQALTARAAQWATRLADGLSPAAFAAVAATAAHRRDHHYVRVAVVADDPQTAAVALDAVAAGRRHPAATPVRRVRRTPLRPVFLFPGQGGQWLGMGERLAAVCPEFRSALQRCDAALAPLLGRSLYTPERGLVFDGTPTVQPAIFAIQVALAEAWRAYGVQPHTVVGHSLGEVAAAHVAGALSLADAAAVIAHRSRLLDELCGAGGMLMVELSEGDAEEIVRSRAGSLGVAALNGPRTAVLSGTPQALAEVEAELDCREVFHRRVSVDFAAHSPQVEPLRPRLRAALAGLDPTDTTVTFHSTVTGAALSGTHLDAEYWATNMRATVRFAEVVQRLYAEGHDVFVEVSPHPVIGRAVSEALGGEALVIASARREDELASLLYGVGELYGLGLAPRWDTPAPSPPVSLPSYPWQHRSYPLLVTPATTNDRHAAAVPLLGTAVRHPDRPDRRLMPIHVAEQQAPYLGDHVVDRMTLMPAALWLAAGVEALRASAGKTPIEVRRLSVDQPLATSVGERVDVQLTVDAAEGGESLATVTSYAGTGHREHATARLSLAAETDLGRLDLTDLPARYPRVLDVAACYARAAAVGIEYGPAFRGLAELRAEDGTALARVRLPESAAGAHAGALLHPAFLDACLQTIMGVLPDSVAERHLPLPVAVDRLVVDPTVTAHEGWCEARLRTMTEDDETGRAVVVDLRCADDSGAVWWRADGVRLHLAPRGGTDPELLTVRWRPYRVRPVQPAPRPWLLLGDDPEVTAPIVAVLQAQGIPWMPWRDDTDGEGLPASAPAPAGVICTWAVSEHATPAGGPAPAEQARRLTERLLVLGRGLAERRWPQGTPELVVLTRGCGPAGSDQPPVGGALWGLGRCVANELPRLRVTMIDLVGPVAAVAAPLARVLRDPDRPGQLLLGPDGCQQPALAVTDATGTPVAVRHDRTYLITGGLGAIGRAVATWLADRGARHLVLIGRTAPGDAAQADLDRLRARGVAVHPARLDVCDRPAMAAIIAQCDAQLPPLGGVAHCAGALADDPVTVTGPAHLERTFPGKVTGAWHLHELTRGMPLDFFVLFSSFAGTLGSPGQSAYAAANTALDALATHRRALGLPAVSIAWGPWADEGLGVSSGGVARLAALGVPALSRGEGLALLDRILTGTPATVSAVRLDREHFDARRFGPAAVQMLPAPNCTPAGAGSDTTVRVLGGDTQADMRTFLRAAVGEALGTAADQVPTDVVFADLGFDSLLLMNLRRRIEEGLGLRLSAAVVWAHPTVDALTAELLRRRSDQRQTATGATPAAAESPHATPATDESVPATVDSLAIDDDDLLGELSAQIDLMKGALQ